MRDGEGDRYDAIVIGSGPGGSSCATLLQKRGIQTLLIEKNNFIGGKMVSIEKDGYAYDLFPHGQVPMRGSGFEAIFAELGVSDEFQPALEPDDDRDIIKIAYRKRGWTSTGSPQGQAMAIPRPSSSCGTSTRRTSRRRSPSWPGLATMPEEQIDELDDVSMHEFLSSRTSPTSSTATWPSTPTPRWPSPSTWWRPRSRSASCST